MASPEAHGNGFEEGAVGSQLKRQQEYLDHVQDTFQPAEVVRCYRATRALLYMRLEKLKQAAAAAAAQPPAEGGPPA